MTFRVLVLLVTMMRSMLALSCTTPEEYEYPRMSVNDDLVPECPPHETDDGEGFGEITGGISAAIGIASDLNDPLKSMEKLACHC